MSRIDENVGATSIHFSKQELNDINHVVDQLEIVGERYNQEQKTKNGYVMSAGYIHGEQSVNSI